MICVKIDTFRQIGGCISFKSKQNPHVFSGSDIESKSIIITSNNKTPQPLSLLWRRHNGGLMTAHSGRSCDKTPVSINSRGRGLGLCDITLLRIWERLDLKKGVLFIGIKKKQWVDFYHYRVDVYTHCQHTFMFKQHVKVNFTSPLSIYSCSI